MRTQKIASYRSIAGAASAGAVLLMAGAAAHAQNLFVGDYASESILEYSGGSPATFATGLDYPTGMAFNSSGDLFESDQFSGNIFEWTPNGTRLPTFASGLSQPNVMAFNSAGNLFVNVGNNVDEFNSAGTIINTITGFNQPAGLAFDKAGNLYVSNLNGQGAGQGYITKVTPLGLQSTFASGLNYPTDMAFNAAGDLFVSGATYDTITEITPAGAESTFATGLNNPNAIIFDSAGDMFVADGGFNNGNGDITEFPANGTETVFASGFRPTSLAIQPVPEPSVLGLLGVSAIALFGWLGRGKAVAKKA